MRFPVGFTWKNVCYYGFKSVGIKAFMTTLFLGTIEWEQVIKISQQFKDFNSYNKSF